MKRTVLFGKPYAWVRATRTRQWRLVSIPDLPIVPTVRPWSDPDLDILAEMRRSLGGAR